MPEGTTNLSNSEADTFRLRNFVEELIAADELEIIEAPTELADLTSHMDGNEKAVLFKKAGPEEAEIIGNVGASRSRLALAFGVAEPDMLPELLKRLATKQPIETIDKDNAPVQEVVWTGDDADFTRLPVPFQHGRDGGPYLSATLDFTVNPETGLTNLGCRRMMLRGRQTAGVDLNAPSDLRAIYEAASGRGERLPVSFILGAHPLDYVAATMRIPVDETELLASLRGAPLKLVKSITNDILIPADAEMVIEGYLDEHGYVEDEGPFGEFAGYYGVMKKNPVFHLTAITMRSDALFQTATISGPYIGRTDTAVLNTLKSEAVVWRALQTAIREPVAVNATGAGAGMFNLRISMRPRVPGEAQNAIAAAFGCLANVKNVFVVNDDIDIFDNDQMEWALATRFQPDRDLVVQGGMRTLPLDPSLYGARVGSKAGFDLTIANDKRSSIEFTVPAPPTVAGEKFDSVRAALEDGPKSYEQLMAAIGTRDGREIVLALDEIRSEGILSRLKEGEYCLSDKD
ncbi:MAG: UbiD family decarboxylase [Alphaproteobacteria bacterium]|nr:UbiD family decarboxylase [Alphaproteobacteria bacterium]